MQLYVAETGPRDASCIVFLHGGGLSGRMWQPQMEALPEYHCIAPDLPEQGRSAAITPFSLTDSAQRVMGLIRERCLHQRAHLVGLSLGGAVALEILRLTPDLVDRVVVSGTAAGLGRVLGSLSKASAALYRYLSAEALVNASIRQFHIPPHYHTLVRDDLRLGASESFARHSTEALMTMQLPTQTTAPILVAVGEHETWFAKQAARKLVAALPSARGVTAPAAGHVWNLQQPDLFIDMVRSWCEDWALPPALRPL